MPERNEGWYVVQAADGTCNVLSAESISRERLQESRPMWGPYATQQEAITRRVGLIRSGKCEPA
ncbi:hypothetical protein [Phormidium tenue]|uniref:DDE transposase family protein n=1 Tax=Phormidium tenue NIES-30 TaxID=549789 RepID=A0A1U7J3S3_9CYAN|nr:hypothetical protein [Phormidium tenue]MBD2233449.1 hypothetical protein [Phormidium tenue FACHB-1052]OKH46897.1 hypothetical protein NIES30_15485 [Phormidium tenue NIES-30]